jgi:hypothetical protein
MNAWRRGAFEYGALAVRLGSSFEDIWLAKDQQDPRAALEKPDFLATTDLYSIVANVYAMRFVPVDLQSLLMVVGAVLAVRACCFVVFPIERDLVEPESSHILTAEAMRMTESCVSARSRTKERRTDRVVTLVRSFIFPHGHQPHDLGPFEFSNKPMERPPERENPQLALRREMTLD